MRLMIRKEQGELILDSDNPLAQRQSVGAATIRSPTGREEASAPKTTSLPNQHEVSLSLCKISEFFCSGYYHFSSCKYQGLM
jgi:hypothetical protein